MNKTWTYKRAGVDRDAAKSFHDLAISKIKSISKTLNFNVFGIEEGRFTNYIELDRYKLTLHADGVGTKVLIAQLMNSYWEVGWDAVAMNVNDLAAGGAKPIGIVDYIALETADRDVLEGLLNGIERACIESEVVLIGGETAIMPDVIKGAVPRKGFDVSVTALGIVLWNVEKGSVGDVIIGLRSNGIHSNGLSLARKVLLSKYKINDPAPYDPSITIGQELLKPTRIYVKACIQLFEKNLVKNFAHITGGAFLKIKRILKTKCGANINVPKPPDIFTLIREEGNVPWDEMYKTFNMGIGLVAITTKDFADEAIKVCRKLGFDADLIGEVTRETGLRINIPDIGMVRIQ